MAPPITLFTGQWADLPFEEVCRLAASWGYDGLEIACWGDHFEVDRALAEDDYVAGRREILERHGLGYEHGFTHLAADLVDALARGVDPEPSFADGLAVQEVMAAVERSAAAGSCWTLVENGSGAAGSDDGGTG